jgi:hypothetical protein
MCGTGCMKRERRPRCRAVHEGDAEATGNGRCRARLNRPGDIVLGSNSDEDKDAVAHRAGTHS